MAKVRTRVSIDGISDDAVTYAKIQNVSATDRILGRSSAGAGDIEEITCTSFARSILDDTSASDVRSTISVQPTASPAFTGASSFTNTGNVVPLTITNDGTANSLVVNDVSSDTTPFVVDASGKVGISTSAPSVSLDVYGADAAISVGTSSYGRFQTSGGNAIGYMYGSFAALGDGVHLTYNHYHNAAGTLVVSNSAGFTSRITAGYGAVMFATSSTANVAPTERVRINSDGNVGIGIATPTLNTNGTVLHIHNSTASRASMIRFTNNESGSTATDGLMVGKWSDGTNYVYDYDNYDLVLGAHNGNKVRVHSVGTSFYQSANGTPSLGSKNFYAATFENLSAGYGLAIGGVNASTGSTSVQVQNFSSSVAYDLLLQPLGGNIGIGTSPDATTKLHLAGTYPTSGTVTRGILCNGLIPSGSTVFGDGIVSFIGTVAASFTCANLRHFVAAQGSIGAGSSVTNQFGYVAESSLTSATNNYGFYSNIASGTGRFNFYANGTATNYFNGSVGIGTASISSGFKVDVRGRLLSYTTSTDGLITVQGLQTESSGTGKSAIQIDVNGKGGFAWQNDASSGTRALRLLENSGYGAGDTTALLYSGGAFTFNRRVDITQGTTTGAQAHCYVRPENGGLGRDSQITFGCTFSNGWGGGDLAARDAGAIRFGANGGSSDPRDWSMRFLVADGPGGSDTPRECMRINTYGNVGIGVTPPAGTSTTSRLHVATDITLYGASRGFLGNVYFDGAWKYASTGYGWAWVDSGSGNIDFARTSTSGTAGATATFLPAMRINDASEVLIGTTTDQGNFKLQVGGNTYLENLYLSTTTNWGRLAINHAGATTFAAGWNNTDTSSTGQTTLNILRNGTSVGTISTTNTATSYNTTSDYRLKANPRPITDATGRISRIRPSQWDWHVGGVGEGFIAHELSEAVPLAVTGEKDAVDATGNPVWQTVDMSKVVPVLVAALQEANARIAALEQRINA